MAQRKNEQEQPQERQRKDQDQPEVHPSVEKNAEANEQRHADAPEETPGGFHPDDARATVAEGKKAEISIGDPLAGLSRNELVRLSTAVSAALDGYGADPEDAPASRGPSLQEQAAALPVNAAASKDVKRSEVAEKAGLDSEDDVLGFAVRQEGASSTDKENDTGRGQKFLTVVTRDGQKKVVKL